MLYHDHAHNLVGCTSCSDALACNAKMYKQIYLSTAGKGLTISCLQTNENTVATTVFTTLDVFICTGMIGGKDHLTCNRLHLHTYPGTFLEACPAPMYIQAP